MTLEAKVAQLVGFMPAGISGHDEAADREQLREAIPHGVGAVSGILEMGAGDPMATARKIEVIQRYLVEETPNGLPALVHAEALNGFVYAGALQFPTPIGMAATFRPDHSRRAAEVGARQMSALGIQHAFSPVLDVSRDPRFGRVHETFGEDPHLCAAFGVAAVQGLQDTGVIATGKHFVAYAASEAALNMASVNLGDREIREVYATPFEAAIRDGNLSCVMNSYASIDGVPVAVDRRILSDLLRTELGFDGLAVSDYGSIERTLHMHGVGTGAEWVAGRALAAGLDVELPSMAVFGAVTAAVESGRLDVALVDRAVRRVLTLKDRAGLLASPRQFTVPDAFPASSAEVANARAAARDSLVLLSNDGTLPLAGGRVAVLGPFADKLRPLYAAYSGPAGYELIHDARVGWAGTMAGTPGDGPVEQDLVGDVPGALASRRRLVADDGLEAAVASLYPDGQTVAAALAATAPAGAVVAAVAGCDHLEDDLSGLPEAVAAAETADVAICVIGEKTGWVGDATGGEGRDRTSLELFGGQRRLLEAVAATGTPLVAVLLSGRPLDITWLTDVAAAIVVAWHPATYGAEEIAHALWGHENPGGKLPITFPRSVGHVPCYAGHRMGSGYRRVDGTEALNSHVDEDDSPAFAFGHGLSYTTFEIGALELSETVVPVGEDLCASVTVANTGDRRGDEVIQLYAHDLEATVVRPVSQLAGFCRVTLDPGESCRISMTVDTRALALWNIDGRWCVEPGRIAFTVGAASDDERDRREVELVGDELILPHRSAWLASVEVAPAGRDYARITKS